MFSKQQEATLNYFFEELLRITALAVDSESHNDEIQLAKFGLTTEMLIEKRLPFRSGATVYFQHKMEALIESRKDFHWEMQDGITPADFLNHQNKKLEALRSSLDQLSSADRNSSVRSAFEGKISGFVAVVSLLEEMAAGRA